MNDSPLASATFALVMNPEKYNSLPPDLRAILDKDVVIAAGAKVGVDHDDDRARGFTVTDSGITVVGKGVHVD